MRFCITQVIIELSSPIVKDLNLKNSKLVTIVAAAEQEEEII
jgi:hypothetical protein